MLCDEACVDMIALEWPPSGNSVEAVQEHECVMVVVSVVVVQW